MSIPQMTHPLSGFHQKKVEVKVLSWKPKRCYLAYWQNMGLVLRDMSLFDHHLGDEMNVWFAHQDSVLK